MSYRALRFEADAAHAEAWSDALLDLGALSIDLSDPHVGTPQETPQYGEPGMPGEPLWPTVRISALFAEPSDGDTAALSDALTHTAAALHLPLPLFEIVPVAERDWVRETQAQFGPIAVTADFWIVPTWSTPPAAARYALRLDPGLAFGTGSHPTTQLCLRWLREHIRPSDTVLDYGCGSGILLLAARLFGAEAAAFGTDIDPQALVASRENAAANRLDAAFVAPDQLPEHSFDLVIANILANPLRALAPLLAGRTAPGGRLILSGILEDQQEELCACYAPWFEIAPTQTLDGWALLAGVKKR